MTEQFKKQLKEDLEYIEFEYSKYDSLLSKKEYAFNFWILTKLYNIDEDCVFDNITEYNDKGIDCFVHYEDNKELYIIQNKYYNVSETSTKDVSDFLKRPLTALISGNYKNTELQKIFNKAINDDEYSVFFHFYASNSTKKDDITYLINDFNKVDKLRYACSLEASYFNIEDIKKIYYGETYKNKQNLKFNFKTPTRGTFAVVRDELGIGIRPSFYIITPVVEIYKLYKDAKRTEYPLFDDNIREWLGNNSINKEIVNTLKSDTDKKDFLYFNNGITMIYESSEPDRIEGGKRIIPLLNPQIVNGCQTTNSIYQALKDYSENEIEDKFSNVFVMVKALKKDAEEDQQFAEDLMKYTNKQNAIPEKAFQAKSVYFERIQKSLKEKGFLLEVKPSDKAKFAEIYDNKKELYDILKKANDFAKNYDLTFTCIKDISIPLEKLLVIILAFIKDGYYAYTKKCYLLKLGSELYRNFSLTILDNLTVSSIIYIYLFYCKAEQDKKRNDGRNPIPYYMLCFLGNYLNSDVNISKRDELINFIFSSSENTDKIYRWIKSITLNYTVAFKEKFGEEGDYNRMIKKEIDWSVFKKEKENLIRYGSMNIDIFEDKIQTFLNEYVNY